MYASVPPSGSVTVTVMVETSRCADERRQGDGK
jgi:hypothetical protein